MDLPPQVTGKKREAKSDTSEHEKTLSKREKREETPQVKGPIKPLHSEAMRSKKTSPGTKAPSKQRKRVKELTEAEMAE